LVESGRVVVKEALTEPEFLEFAGVGRLEAVNTDGLRSLAVTLGPRVQNMKEKTLRYVGHYDMMRALKDAGMFSEKEIDVGGTKVRPRDVACAVMFPAWTYGPGEEDLTVMRVVIEGTRVGKRDRVVWDLEDVFDRASAATCMSSTTGLACTAVARMIASGKIAERGVIVPERLGEMPGMLEAIVAELGKRGVRLQRRQEQLESERNSSSASSNASIKR
jgi:saccharopine dehydrogenase-like NADP-dependent oxidoreductase